MAVAELKAKLGMDDSEFTRVIRKSVNTAKTAGSQMSGAFSGIGSSLAGFVTTGAIVNLGRKIFDDASSLQDMSDALNISTDSLQQFTFAFAQSGGSQEAFVKGLTAVNGKIEEARDGNDKTIATFEKLGVSIEEIKDPTFTGEKALLRFADALKASGSSADQLAAFGDIVGSKIQNKMVPALKNGSEAFLNLGKSAKIMSSDVISSLDDASDMQEKFIKDTTNSFVNTVAAQYRSIAQAIYGGSDVDNSPENQRKLNIQRANEKENLRGVKSPFDTKPADAISETTDSRTRKAFAKFNNANFGGNGNNTASLAMQGLQVGRAMEGSLGQGFGVPSGNRLEGSSMLDVGVYKTSADAYKTNPAAYHSVHRGDKARNKEAAAEAAKQQAAKEKADSEKAAKDAAPIVEAINNPAWTRGGK